MWILSGLVLGSIITSTHDTEEACRGRKAMLEQLREIHSVECRRDQRFATTTSSGNVLIYGGK